MPHSHQYGTYHLGRLKYRTAEEARGAARDLGLSGVHQHTVDGETVFMPGANCEQLQAALKKLGLPASKPCQTDGGGMMGGGMGTGMVPSEDQTVVGDMMSDAGFTPREADDAPDESDDESDTFGDRFKLF